MDDQQPQPQTSYVLWPESASLGPGIAHIHHSAVRIRAWTEPQQTRHTWRIRVTENLASNDLAKSVPVLAEAEVGDLAGPSNTAVPIPTRLGGGRLRSCRRTRPGPLEGGLPDPKTSAAYQARSCAAPTVALPASSFPLLVSSSPPQFLRSTTSSWIHLLLGPANGVPQVVHPDIDPARAVAEAVIVAVAHETLARARVPADD